jgi:tetratricopeptide (TPR) repeat protein
MVRPESTGLSKTPESVEKPSLMMARNTTMLATVLAMRIVTPGLPVVMRGLRLVMLAFHAAMPDLPVVIPGLPVVMRLSPVLVQILLALIIASTLAACKSLPGAKTQHEPQPLCLELLATGESAFSKGDVETADKCFREGLKEAEKSGKDDKNVALALNDLALTTAVNKTKTGTVKEKLPQAIAYQKRSVEIEKKIYGIENAYVAYDLNNLGAWYNANQQYKEGGEALEQAVKIREKVLGPKSVLLAFTEANLAESYAKQKRYADAARLLTKSKAIYAQNNQPLEAARVAESLADLFQDEKKFDQAEVTLKEVLSDRENALGKNSMMVAETLNSLAVCLLQDGKYKEAEPLFSRSLTIVQKGGDHEIIASVVAGYGKCLDKLGKKTEAKKLRQSVK